MKTKSILGVGLAFSIASLLPAGATLIWHSAMDGNAAALVGGDGVATGGPVATADLNGNPGGAVLFDGATQFFTVPSALGAFTAGSISIWVRCDDTAGQKGPISLGESGGGVAEYFTIQNTDGTNLGKWRVDVDDGDGSGLTRVDTLSDTATSGQWEHLVAAFTAQSQLMLYVDGVPQTEVQSMVGGDPSIIPTNPWLIGAERTTERFFTGAIDDVRIFDHELGQGEVTTLYNSGPLVVPEPASAILLLGGLLGLIGFRRRAS